MVRFPRPGVRSVHAGRLAPPAAARPAQWSRRSGTATPRPTLRERRDAFAVRSHRLAASAQDEGFYELMIADAPGVDLERDERIRPDTSEGTVRTLPAAFPPDGTITAGNASLLNDGASAVLVGADLADSAIGVDPLARIAAHGATALEPQSFGYAAVVPGDQARALAGIGRSDVRAIELNEVFAARCLACVDEWGIDLDIVNTRGDAIAIRHPFGVSGVRIRGTLAHVLVERGERWAVAAICIGGGQGLAVVLKNVAP